MPDTTVVSPAKPLLFPLSVTVPLPQRFTALPAPPLKAPANVESTMFAPLPVSTASDPPGTPPDMTIVP